MQRRSSRGGRRHPETSPADDQSRQDEGCTSACSPSRSCTPDTDLSPASEHPPFVSNEVVLNRRGMPVRQRKRNRLYFHEDMITPDFWRGSGHERTHQAKVVKQEPMDVPEDKEEILGDVPRALLKPYEKKSTTRGKAASLSPSYGTGKESTRETKGKKTSTMEKVTKKPPPGRPRSQPKPSQVEIQQPSLMLLKPSPSKPPSRLSKVPMATPYKSPLPRVTVATPEIKPDPCSPLPSASTGPVLPQHVWEPISSESKDENAQCQFQYMQNAYDRQNSSKFHQDLDRIMRDLENDYDRMRDSAKKENEELSVDYLLNGGGRIQKARKLPILKDDVLKHLGIPSTPMSPGQQMITCVIPRIGTTPLNDEKRRIAQSISYRLRNHLKLPKAHKWVCYEWFYSNIDKIMFEGETDFQACLKETFPRLKTKKLARTEWTKIRRMMGKPRRCSQAFLDEEREELARSRARIRQVQQRKLTDFSYKELPDEIPLQISIGTKVTARLRRPQDGLFTGTVEGMDVSDNTYRITFDRQGLGTHSVPDYEVLSNDPPETMSTSSFAMKMPRRNSGYSMGTFKIQNPALLGGSNLSKSQFPAEGMLGGFPIRLLDMIVRFSKLLKVKQEKIMTFRELNVEGEKLKSYGKPFRSEYKERYAKCIISLETMNKAADVFQEEITAYLLEIMTEHGSKTQLVIPEVIRTTCRQDASMMVSTYNAKSVVQSNKISGLIAQLASMMLQMRVLLGEKKNPYELKSLRDTVKETKATLEGGNLQCFQNSVEIRMNRIMAGLCAPPPPLLPLHLSHLRRK